MLDYIELWHKKVDGKFVKGQQHNNMLVFVSNAKFFHLEAQEALAAIKNSWHGKFEDEKSFWDAWNDRKTEPDIKYGEKNNEHLASSRDETKDPDFNRAFRDFIANSEVEEKEFDVRDTSILKWWYKEDDWIQIVSDKYSACEIASDVKTLADKEAPMKNLQFMSIASFKNGDGKRKNANVKENRMLLLECDHLPKNMQLKFFYSLIEFGLPVKSIIDSGNKSYHCLLKIHPMKNVDEYKAYCEEAFKELNRLWPKLIDDANKDGVRYTRAPFGYRAETKEVQKLIWCDEIPMDEEKFDFEDTLEQIRRYVGNFISVTKQAEMMKDSNGHVKFEYMSSLKEGCGVEDIFITNGKYMIKLKDMQLQNCGKQEIWDTTNFFIDESIVDIILEGKGEKKKHVTLNDFYFKLKDIVYDISETTKSDKVYNMFEAGFYTECQGMDVREMPSEFDKLLDNLADENCKNWLINHLACYFKLLQNGFNHPLKGAKHPLETVPVFYGKSGTGKNTLMDVIGRAICRRGATDISISNLADDFNEFYKAGLININEAAKGKTERKATKEALKRFTDIWKQLNQKFMPKVDLFNGAYKTISANESLFGVLDIDNFDRRFQYITGGGQLNGQEHHICDMKLLKEQEKDFIAFLMHYGCDFKKAETVFDNEAKVEDKIQSMSNPEKVAFYIYEHYDAFPEEFVSVRTAILWYNNMTANNVQVDARMLGKCLQKWFTIRKQMGKATGMGDYSLMRGEWGYSIKSVVKGININDI